MLELEQLQDLAKLLEQAHNGIGAYAQQHWDGYIARIYRECGEWSKQLKAIVESAKLETATN